MKKLILLLAFAMVVPLAGEAEEGSQGAPQVSSESSRGNQGSGHFLTHLDRRYIDIDKSPEGLEKYKGKSLKMQRQARNMGLERVHATITLEEPLTLDEALTVMEEYGIKPRLLYAFSDKDDNVLTRGFAFGSRNREAATALARKVADEEGLVGMVSIIAMVPVAKIQDLQKDPRVFLVDLSADENFTTNNGNKQYMHHLAWDVYHNKKAARARKQEQ